MLKPLVDIEFFVLMEDKYDHLQIEEPQTQLWLFNIHNGVETWGLSLNEENNLEKDFERRLVSMIACMKSNKACSMPTI